MNNTTGFYMELHTDRIESHGDYITASGAGDERAYLGGDGFGGDVQFGSAKPGLENAALWNRADNAPMNLWVKTLSIAGGAGSGAIYGSSGSFLGTKDFGERRHVSWFSSGDVLVNTANSGFRVLEGLAPVPDRNEVAFFTVAEPGVSIIAYPSRAHLTKAGVWQSVSDRNRKTDFVAVNAREVLQKVAALSIQSWRYTNEPGHIRHLGPSAQDFRVAFGLGTDDKSIGTIDADGVALFAIQGLNEALVEKDARLAALETEMASLKEQLAAQQHALARWENRFAALEQAAAGLSPKSTRTTAYADGEPQ